jgi:hypothetical protein
MSALSISEGKSKKLLRRSLDLMLDIRWSIIEIMFRLESIPKLASGM